MPVFVATLRYLLLNRQRIVVLAAISRLGPSWYVLWVHVSIIGALFILICVDLSPGRIQVVC